MPGPPLTGAVLCGGASRRMGSPKALVEVDDVPMARRVADALHGAGATRVVLVGGDPGWAAALGLPMVPDRWPGEGPLGGLATALLDGPDDPGGGAIVLVAPCDQPWLDAASAMALADALRADPGASAAAPRSTDGRRQPFPVAWRAAAAPAVAALVEAGERRADAAFALVSVVLVALPDAVLADVDRPADLPGGGASRGEGPGSGASAP